MRVSKLPRKKKQEAEHSHLREYCEKVRDGEIVACKKVRQMADIMLSRIDNGYKRWHFDIKAAQKPIAFIEQFCKIPTGRLGQPMKLELFQKAWVESIFGFVDDDGLRQVQELFIPVGRKNAKTTLVAAVELYMLTCDGEGAPQIYNAATSLDQANLGFNAAYKMVRQSAEIAAHVKKRTDQLYCDLNFGFIKPLAANTTTLDGLDVHLGVIDELHAMKSRDIYDLIKQGMSARSQPLLVQITTNGFVRNGVFDDQYEYAAKWLSGDIADDRFIAWVYELDDRSEWDEEKCWIKANPGLGTIKSLEYQRNAVNKAKQDKSYKATVLTKDMNLPANSSVAWLDYTEAINPACYFGEENGMPRFKDLGFRYGICGFDASDSVDLTSAQMLVMRPGDDTIYMRSMYWMPEDVLLASVESGDRKERDGVPYQQWIARGLMRTVPGNKIDKRVLLDWLEELREEEDLYCFAIGYDPWHMTEDYLKEQLRQFVGSSRVREVRFGPRTLSQPMKMLKAEYQANRIVDNHNPINEWCRMNVQIKADVNDNIQPMKKNGDPRNRIDGFAAEIAAYITYLQFKDEYEAYI